MGGDIFFQARIAVKRVRFGVAHDLIQLLLQLPLIIDQQLRVANDVDKQDVPDLELQIGCGP
jgi:hypothetical protein